MTNYLIGCIRGNIINVIVIADFKKKKKNIYIYIYIQPAITQYTTVHNMTVTIHI